MGHEVYHLPSEVPVEILKLQRTSVTVTPVTVTVSYIISIFGSKRTFSHNENHRILWQSATEIFANPTSVTLTEVLCTNLPNMGIYLSVRVTSVPSEWRHFSLGRPQDWPRCNVGFGVCLRGLPCMTSTKLMDFWTPSANLCCLSANFKNILTTPFCLDIIYGSPLCSLSKERRY